MPEQSLQHSLEALLFVANEPLPLKRIAELLEVDADVAAQALDELAAGKQSSGLRVSHLHGTYQLVTAPEAGPLVRRYLEAETRPDLTKPALETLAIIAYRGPLTRAQLDELRGVTSDTMVRNLLSRGLIAEAGVADQPGHPPLYAVSHTFLHHFGLSSLAELPPLEEPAAKDDASED